MLTTDFVRAVLREFVRWTSHTVVHGDEHTYYGQHLLAMGFEQDEVGNYRRVVGEGSTTMFCAHLDTATAKTEPVNHKLSQDGRFITTDGKTILGADDKAGVVVLMHLLRAGVPGLYYLFLGEERGGIGSHAIAEKDPDYFATYKRAIAFDRRGTTSIITRQSGGDCTSAAFAADLSARFSQHGMFLDADTGGSFTDTASFMHLIPECTNLSIGYTGAHSNQEKQDLYFLAAMCHIAPLIAWDEVVAVRTPVAKVTYTSNYRSDRGVVYGRGGWEDDDSVYGSGVVTPRGRYEPANPAQPSLFDPSAQTGVMVWKDLVGVGEDPLAILANTETSDPAITGYLKTYFHQTLGPGPYVYQTSCFMLNGNKVPLHDARRTLDAALVVMQLYEEMSIDGVLMGEMAEYSPLAAEALRNIGQTIHYFRYEVPPARQPLILMVIAANYNRWKSDLQILWRDARIA